MTEGNIISGTPVVSATGEQIGVVESSTEVRSGNQLEMLVRASDQLIRVQQDLIDSSRSSADGIVLTAAFDEPDFQQDIMGEPFHKTLELKAEEMRLDVHEVQYGRAIIEQKVERVPVVQEIELGTDFVEVNRVPSGEEFDVAPEPRQEGDTLIIPLVEEVLVLTRRYRVIEEVHVTTRRTTHVEQVEDELQRHVITVREELNDGTVIE